jgi:hypothetical protein
MAYFMPMRFSRLLSILALLAVLFAPAGMLGSHAAMAMPQQHASAQNHCPEQQQPDERQQRAMIDCAIACTALPGRQPAVGRNGIAPAAMPEMAPDLFVEGTRPEADTPPPRFS